ncbi:MAG: CoA transferase [Deltaproteobacteria bacterium]|nr:CoA transferase [Deltaproteobacteria bacterium]
MSPPPRPLHDVRVLDFSSGIAGAYCSKLFADAGAEVIKVETAAGDPLRRWSASGAELGADDAPFFQFLHFSKRSVVLAPAAVDEALCDADVAIEGPGPDWFDPAVAAAQHAHLVVVSISPWGRSGPWAGRPASDFTLQAESGSIGGRGVPGGEPFAIGGRTGEFLAGSYAAVAALAALRRARRSGEGEWIDLSLLETLALGTTNFLSILFQMLEMPPSLHGGGMATVETPSIEPTADGYVGFCTNARQQFADFLLLIERPELQEDEMLAQVAGRLARFDEWQGIVRAWTRAHTTAAIVERATALRIPVAPVLDGERVRDHPQVVARGVYRQAPGGGFAYPRPPYKLDGAEPAPPTPAPRLGEHGTAIAPRRRARRPIGARGVLPLAGVRILDLTTWWAGPACTQILAAFGAEVIHVESPQRPDGVRMLGGMVAGRYQRWWECSQFFLAANAGKQAVTLHLSDARGRALLGGLIARADAVVENFTPRVLDNFGVDWDFVARHNPRCLMLRMPAFGLDGPWRDAPGFAQTMEQLSGLAWVTGHRADQPRIQRGPCDPMAGMHGAFALLLALLERERSGRGMLVESTMLEAALNAAAEQVVEFTAHGRRLERMGNRAPYAAPQGLYACRPGADGLPRWLALSIETDAQWRALCAALPAMAWADDAGLARLAGRQARHDEIDARLAALFADEEQAAAVDRLIAAGVPAAAVVNPTAIHRHPQVMARGFCSAPPHPVVGAIEIPGLPFRCRTIDVRPRRAAPTLGEHNQEILRGWLGLSEAALRELEAEGVVGTRPVGL